MIKHGPDLPIPPAWFFKKVLNSQFHDLREMFIKKLTDEPEDIPVIKDLIKQIQNVVHGKQLGPITVALMVVMSEMMRTFPGVRPDINTGLDPLKMAAFLVKGGIDPNGDPRGEGKIFEKIRLKDKANTTKLYSLSVNFK